MTPLGAQQHFFNLIYSLAVYIYIKKDMINYSYHIYLLCLLDNKITHNMIRIKYFNLSRLGYVPYQNTFSKILCFAKYHTYISLYFTFY